MKHTYIFSIITLLCGLYLFPTQPLFADKDYPSTETVQAKIRNFNPQTYTPSKNFDIGELHRNFVFYPKYVFDTAQGIFDEALNPQELTLFQTLWKQIRQARGYPTGKNCGRLAFKANFILQPTRFLQNHVIFLINEHRQVYQWYDVRKEPLDDGCICTAFLTDNPIVIRQDGSFGFSLLPGNKDEEDDDLDISNFNRMIANENITLTTMFDVIELADMYLNLSTKAKMITLEYLDDYTHRLYENYAYHQEKGDQLPNRPVYDLIDIPRVQFTNDQITITFYSWAGAAFASPRSFVRWDMKFTPNGKILAAEQMLILE